MFYIRGLSPERTNTSNWGHRQTLPRGLPSERTNTSNRGYRQTLPRGLPSERTNTSNWGDRQTLPRGLPSERTNTSNRGGYRQTLLNRGLLSDETTTKPQEIKRENQQTLHQRGTSSGRPESIKQLSKIHQ